MSGNRAAIKARIKSINATKKITGAMNLISNVKLQKERAKLEKRKTYTEELRDIVDKVFNSEHNFNHAYFNENNAEKKYILLICSDLGMCGAYNANLLKFFLEHAKPEDYINIIGTNLYKKIDNCGFKIQNDVVSSDNQHYVNIKDYAEIAIDLFLRNEINEIDIIYTKFVNTVTFDCDIMRLLPLSNSAQENNINYIYLEPKPIEVLEELIPMMIKNSFYSIYVEAKTAEQGSRRLAMENATDNAEELVEKLTLQYNQARQAAITQEITEIVSGADAL